MLELQSGYIEFKSQHWRYYSSTTTPKKGPPVGGGGATTQPLKTGTGKIWVGKCGQA